MTPNQLRDARAALGDIWGDKPKGKNPPISMSHLGRILKLKGRDPGATIRDWERGHQAISGPVSVAIEALLAGFRPKHMGVSKDA
jgi:hypothetical protein